MEIEFPTLTNARPNYDDSTFEPLDLSENAVAAFWKNYSYNEAFYIALAEMSSKDKWAQTAFQDAGVYTDLENVLNELRNEAVADSVLIARLDDLLLIMGYLKSSQALRLLYWIEKERPELNGAILRKLISAIEKGKDTQDGYFLPETLLLHRLGSLKQLVLMQRVFDEKRMKRVQSFFAAFEQAEYPENAAESTVEAGALNTGIKVA